MSQPSDSRLFVAVGSPHGDDRVAWEIADLLNSGCAGELRVRKAAAPIDMIDWLKDVSELHIIDACEGGGVPGEILRCSWHTEASDSLPGEECTSGEPAQMSMNPTGSANACTPEAGDEQVIRLRRPGTHDFDVLSVLELARRLGRLPARVVIRAIVGSSFEPGDALSHDIQHRLPALAAAVAEEMDDAREISCAITAKAD